MFGWFKKIIYALPFGLKAGNEILSTDNGVDGGTTITKKTEQKSVLNDLLNGEVTQEVEELRYSTYEVSEKSREYKYVGNGLAMKKDEKPIIVNGKKRFTQQNKLIVSSVLDELNRINDYGVESYVVKLEYEGVPRYRVDSFITDVDVKIDINNGRIETRLHFNTLPNPYNPNSMPFINELRKLSWLDNEYELKRNAVVYSFTSMSFVTDNATNDEPNLMSYTFTHPTFESYSEDGCDAVLVYSWERYDVVNLKDKFYSATQAEKYKNKEKKDAAPDILSFKVNNAGVNMDIWNKYIEEKEKNENSDRT